MLEIDIWRNSSQNNVGVLRGVLFKGLGVQKDTQMPCWLLDHASQSKRIVIDKGIDIMHRLSLWLWFLQFDIIT